MSTNDTIKYNFDYKYKDFQFAITTLFFQHNYAAGCFSVDLNLNCYWDFITYRCM